MSERMLIGVLLIKWKYWATNGFFWNGSDWCLMVDTDLTLFFARFAWANTETTEDIWNNTTAIFLLSTPLNIIWHEICIKTIILPFEGDQVQPQYLDENTGSKSLPNISFKISTKLSSIRYSASTTATQKHQELLSWHHQKPESHQSSLTNNS